MARVSTKTGVCNLSATYLKTDAVTSVEPPDPRSKAAKLFSQWYDDSRREVLAETDWDFARRRTQVAASPDAPAFGRYARKFPLPADYIRLSSLGDERNPETDYEIEDGYILCNLEAPLKLIYIYDHEDISKWSPKFLNATAIKIAFNTCYALTGNRAFAAQLQEQYEMAVGTASTIDGQQNPPKKIQRSKWAARRQAAFGSNIVSDGAD